ncbi:MAG: hypothetical protein Q9213_006089 [Squamulea squamosa]
MIGQDELHGIDITLFPRKGNKSIELHADVDKDILHPILQKSVLNRLKLQYTLCDAPQIKDKKGRNHTPIGRVDLVWYKTGHHTEHEETFYVVESKSPDIVLKKTGNNDTSTAARPLGLGAQSSEAEKQQVRNKAEADKKRAEEQKKREADEKQQQAQASGKQQ